MPEWPKLSTVDKVKITSVIYFRIFSFVLGLPISLLSLVINGLFLVNAGNYLISGHGLLIVSNTVSLLSISGLTLWLGGIQFGLYFNLRYSRLSRIRKTIEHIKILLVTPVAGVIETYGAVKAVTKWTSGRRKVVWEPTPKIFAHQPILEESLTRLSSMLPRKGEDPYYAKDI